MKADAEDGLEAAFNATSNCIRSSMQSVPIVQPTIANIVTVDVRDHTNA